MVLTSLKTLLKSLKLLDENIFIYVLICIRESSKELMKEKY